MRQHTQQATFSGNQIRLSDPDPTANLATIYAHHAESAHGLAELEMRLGAISAHLRGSCPFSGEDAGPLVGAGIIEAHFSQANAMGNTVRHLLEIADSIEAALGVPK